MSTRIPRIAIGVPVLLCLGACQSMHRDERPALSLVPADDVRHGAPRPEALYALGRYYQGQINYDKAIVSYRALLESQPRHADARNALGMIFAAQGRYDQAIAELVQAAIDAPDSARIRNNLGYAHMLRGDRAKAVAILEAAAKLDPHNERVYENLRIALAATDTDSPPPSGPGKPVETGTVLAKAAPAASASEAPPLPAAAGADMRLKAVAPNIFSLVPAAPMPASVAPERSNLAGGPVRVRLEVSNGNGVTGMARRTSRELQNMGYAKARLTNERPYRLPRTEIQYRPGFETQARELQSALRPTVPLIASSRLRSDIQLRLALGKDVRSALDVLAQTPAPGAEALAKTEPPKDIESPG